MGAVSFFFFLDRYHPCYVLQYFIMATSLVETITPEKAKEYLDKHSGRNRNISKPVVDSYATSMREGKWMLNGEPIVFDVYGILQNGYHRLHAVIKANVPIQTFVVRGVEPEVFVTFDCGRHRTVGQLIGMQGFKNYNCISSAVQLSYRLKIGSINADMGVKKIGKTNSEMIEYFNTDRDLFSECGNFARSMRECPILDASVVGGMTHYLVRYGGYDIDFVKDFFKMVCSFDTCEVHIVDLLRKRLLKNKSSVVEKMNRGIILALVIKTWNCYISGTGSSVKFLRFTKESEEFPTLILKKK